MTTRRAYDTTAYKKNRATLLRDNPPCTYCGRQATEADHIIPIQAGGDNSLDNLTPACKPCNSRRGQRTRQQIDSSRIAARKQAMGGTVVPIAKAADVFYGEPALTPTQLGEISLDSNQPQPAGKGHDQPRLETPWTDEHGTLAANLGGWAKQHLKVDLMPWQLHALAGLTALKADGTFQHRTGLISTARQNGKTVALTTLIGYFLTEEPKRRGQPVKVLSTAHILLSATEIFYELAPILEDYYGAKVSKSYGRNEVRMPDGSRWMIRAAAPAVGHGLSLDLVVADEIWDISADAIDQGLMPTMRARPNPLFAMWSTAGTEASTVFLRYREQGIRAIDKGKTSGFYMAEWSPPPDLDPMTRTAWEYGNPALGTTLRYETLEAEAASPDRAAFLRASVNLWVASTQGWLKPGLWSELELTEPVPAGGTVAIETSLDDSRYFGLRCVPIAGNRVAVTVEFQVDTLAECTAEIERLAPTGCNYAISPTIDLHFPEHLQHRKTVVGYGELLKWTPAARNAIMQRQVWHTGEAQLAEHVNRAVAVKSQGSIALSSQRSPGPIELARCLVWAVALTMTARQVGRPIIARRTG